MWGKRNPGQVSFPKRAVSSRQSWLSAPGRLCFRLHFKKKKKKKISISGFRMNQGG